MSLLNQQRSLADILRGEDLSDAAAADPYLTRVASSTNLDVVKEIGHWWKAFGIEQWCPLTSALLTQQNRFTSAVEDFCHGRELSQYIEQNGTAFLTELADDWDSLVRSVARFELAMLRAAKGELAEVLWIDWDRDPCQVLQRLMTGEPAAESAKGRYRTWVSTELPRLFEVG